MNQGFIGAMRKIARLFLTAAFLAVSFSPVLQAPARAQGAAAAIAADGSVAPSPAASPSPSAYPCSLCPHTATPGPDSGEGRASASSAQSPAERDGLAELPGERAFRQTHDASVMDPTSWAVMAYKSRHQVLVYFKGRLFGTLHAVFGRNRSTGTKLWQGDSRTPEGLYTIVKKYPSRRFHWFLRLNYPNKVDRIRYEGLREDDQVPMDEQEGKIARAGGAIGIHGTDQPILNSGNVDWTTGCISVDNDAVFKLYELLPLGTIVVIKP